MQELSRRDFIKRASSYGIGSVATATLLGACNHELAVRAGTAKRPNILFLLTDNHRQDALGCYGNPIIQTPNVDRLARQGLRFTNTFCTTSICAATRASILTGQYRRSHGYTFSRPPMTIQAMRESYPALLKKAGYRTGFVGKMGIDLEKGAAEEMFDFHRFAIANNKGKPYYRRAPDGTIKHMTRINGDRAIEFLKSSKETQPFCLSVSFSAPHPEDDNPDQYIYDQDLKNLYVDATIPPPPVSESRHFEALPEFIRVSMGRERWFRRFDTAEKYQRMMKAMYRLITGVDIQVGRILDEIKKLGIEDNTVIVFTSDNGLLTGEHGLTGIWLMYDPSIRLPLVIYDPRLAEARRGKVVSELALDIDFAPMLLALAGVETPRAMQGRSLAPLLEGQVQNWPTDFFYEHYFRAPWRKTNKGNIPRSVGVRGERWKYVYYFDEKPTYEQLFDLKNDPHEANNLASTPDHRKTLEAMRHRMEVLQARGGPPWKPVR